MKKFLILLLSILLLSSCATLTRDMVSEVALSPEMPLEEKLLAFGARETMVDSPECFYSGEEWTEKLLQLIDGSEDYIFISTFLGSYCESLDGVYDALERKAREGVRIYYVADGTSVSDQTLTRNYMSPLFFLRDAGAKVLYFNDLSVANFTNPATFLRRDHRKLFVFDGKCCVLGGMNMNYISLGAGERSQRDSMYLFSSSSLQSLLVEDFVTFWNRYSVETIDLSSFPVEGEVGNIPGYFLNHMDSSASLSGFLGSLIAEAKESIYLLPFLPALDKNMEAALRNAVERGVEVTLVFPIDDRGNSADGMVYYFPDLLENTGVKVKLSEKDAEGNFYPLLHEKMLVVDGRYTVIGSSNFNLRSMGLSNEIVLMLDDPSFASSSLEHLDTIISGCIDLTQEYAEKEKKRRNPTFLNYLMVYLGG